jgi:hypothetical protein
LPYFTITTGLPSPPGKPDSGLTPVEAEVVEPAMPTTSAVNNDAVARMVTHRKRDRDIASTLVKRPQLA